MSLRRTALLLTLISLPLWARGLGGYEPLVLAKFRDSLDECWPVVASRLPARFNSIDRLQDSLNVRCVGRWPFGPSYLLETSDQIERDSLLFLGSGSGVRILKVSNPRVPRTVGKIDALGMMGDGSGVVKQGERLYVLSANYGLEIYSIADPEQPVKLGGMPVGTWNRDLAVKDSFAYAVGWDSLVRVISVADPEHCTAVDSLGPYSEPTWACGIQGNYLFVAAQHNGLRAIDISDPRDIREVGSIGGFTGLDVELDGGYAYVAAGAGGLRVIRIAGPDSMQEVASLTSFGIADLCRSGSFLYTICATGNNAEFHVVDVAAPEAPLPVGDTLYPGWGSDVAVLSWLSHAYTADDWEGLHSVDVSDPARPRPDTVQYGADLAVDVYVDNGRAYIANYRAGLQIVDVSDPHSPTELGAYDTVGMNPSANTAAAVDSYAYLPWPLVNRWMRSVDVSDPQHPRFAGLPDSCEAVAQDMVIRDTFLYIAANHRFLIFSIADPASPRLVGSCGLADDSRGLVLDGERAFVANGRHLRIIDISQPSAPVQIESLGLPHAVVGVAVRDTLAYIAADQIYVACVAAAGAPHVVDSCATPGYSADIAIAGSLAFVGESPGSDASFRVYDLSEPLRPREAGHYSPPEAVRRVVYHEPYVYAACYGAGVIVVEAVPGGAAEKKGVRTGFNYPRLDCWPSPAAERIWFRIAASSKKTGILRVFDLGGRLVGTREFAGPRTELSLSLDALTPGVFFAVVNTGYGQVVRSFVKR